MPLLPAKMNAFFPTTVLCLSLPRLFSCNCGSQMRILRNTMMQIMMQKVCSNVSHSKFTTDHDATRKYSGAKKSYLDGSTVGCASVRLLPLPTPRFPTALPFVMQAVVEDQHLLLEAFKNVGRLRVMLTTYTRSVAVNRPSPSSTSHYSSSFFIDNGSSTKSSKTSPRDTWGKVWQQKCKTCKRIAHSPCRNTLLLHSPRNDSPLAQQLMRVPLTHVTRSKELWAYVLFSRTMSLNHFSGLNRFMESISLQ